MIKSRQTSVVILITLAELAWLAAFGLLFAYRGKVGELGKMREDLIVATNEVAMWRTNAPDAAKLLDDLKAANTEKANLQARLDAFTKQLQGQSPEQVGKLLMVAEQAAKRIEAAEAEAKKRVDELAEWHKSIEELQTQLTATNKLLAELKRKWDALPPNVAELENQLREATNKLATVGLQLIAAGAQIVGLSNKVGHLESGEVAIRRELIGLPTNELRRVIFIVDTSSSMHGSPAWKEARNLMRTWVEYLSVEECALINFNDKAVAFPKTNYHRLRERGGSTMPERRSELLDEFDKARPGTYSDLLEGLKLAYSRPKPDLIVLFTDGHPHVATSMDSSFATAILKEVSFHPKTPILTVAVGGYEVEGAGGPREKRNAAIAFLKQLAAQTGGNFVGR